MGRPVHTLCRGALGEVGPCHGTRRASARAQGLLCGEAEGGAMKRHRSLVAVLLCSILPVLPGCSFWAVRGPNARVRGGGDCTTSVAAPVTDGIFAVGAIAGGAYAASRPPCDPRGPSNGFFGPCFIDMTPAIHGAGGFLIGFAVLEAAAAIYGGTKVAACHEAKAEVQLPLTRGKP